MSIRMFYENFLVHARKTKFQPLGFDVGIRVRKSFFREGPAKFLNCLKSKQSHYMCICSNI